MKVSFSILILLFSGSLVYGFNGSGHDSNQKKSASNVDVKPEDIPNLISFWDFQEPSGQAKIATGKHQYALEEMNGPIERVEDGVFGPYSADLQWGQWFRVKRSEAPGLDLHGDEQQITMISWVKRESDRVWQYIAGMWNEGDMKFKGKPGGKGEGAPARQYAIFINGAWQNDYATYERTRAEYQPMGYISPFGGATPDHPFAFDYATGKTKMKQNQWYMVAFTFDGEAIKVYLDGQLDENSNYNPFLYDGPIYDPGPTGADFTVAQRDHPRWPTYPEAVPEYEEGFDGRIGGLAIYDRALSADEIKSLYNSSMK